MNVARILIQHKADVEAIAGDASTPLLLASVGGNHDVMRVLLGEGRANPNGSEKLGPQTWSPLRVAVHQRDVHAVELLLAAGANANEGSSRPDVDGGRGLRIHNETQLKALPYEYYFHFLEHNAVACV